jgi:ETC complex I subunit conserved region
VWRSLVARLFWVQEVVGSSPAAPTTFVDGMINALRTSGAGMPWLTETVSMRARIFQPPKTAMQSGWAKAQDWALEFTPTHGRRADPLMGWTGGGDTQTQVKLFFDTRDEAIAYAERAGIQFEVELPQARRIKPKAYADNFKWSRIENWTH